MESREKDTQQTVSREHVVPQAYGGPNTDDNIVLAHRICNNWRGTTINYCGCDFCVRATDKYWYMGYFGNMVEEDKPKVFKKYGKWFVQIGKTIFARDTFEEAHCTLYLRKYYV